MIIVDAVPLFSVFSLFTLGSSRPTLAEFHTKVKYRDEERTVLDISNLFQFFWGSLPTPVSSTNIFHLSEFFFLHNNIGDTHIRCASIPFILHTLQEI